MITTDWRSVPFDKINSSGYFCCDVKLCWYRHLQIKDPDHLKKHTYWLLNKIYAFSSFLCLLSSKVEHATAHCNWERRQWQVNSVGLRARKLSWNSSAPSAIESLNPGCTLGSARDFLNINGWYYSRQGQVGSPVLIQYLHFLLDVQVIHSLIC